MSRRLPIVWAMFVPLVLMIFPAGDVAPIKLSGTVTRIEWTNPHIWFYVDVKNPTSGQVVSWEVESAGASNLLRAGLRKEDFIGAEVIIKGFLAKDGTPAVNASTFTIVGANGANKEYKSEDPTP